MGCPDWPKCFGEWFPPTSPQALADALARHPELDDLRAKNPGVDRILESPTRLDVVFAWIEYLNRAYGMVVGLLIAATAALTLVYARSFPRIVLTAWGAGILTAFQAWLGKVVVDELLEPLLVTAHLILALAIVAMLLYVAQAAHYRARPAAESAARYPEGLARGLRFLLAGVVLQILLGAFVRGAHGMEKGVEGRESVVAKGFFETAAPYLEMVHQTLGLFLAGGAAIAAVILLQRVKRASALVRQCSIAVVITATLQVLLGSVLSLGELPLVQLFHLWSGSLLLVVLVVLVLAVSQGRRAEAAVSLPETVP